MRTAPLYVPPSIGPTTVTHQNIFNPISTGVLELAVSQLSGESVTHSFVLLTLLLSSLHFFVPSLSALIPINMVTFIALASVLVAAASSFAAPAGMIMRRQSVGQTLTGGS